MKNFNEMWDVMKPEPAGVDPLDRSPVPVAAGARNGAGKVRKASRTSNQPRRTALGGQGTEIACYSVAADSTPACRPQPNNRRPDRTRIRERISSASEISLVAKENGKVVGVCRVIRREDKDVVEAIYVLPEYQRLGIGSAIWREIQKLLDPTRKIIVQVATHNTDAIEFYKRCGFRDTGKRWEETKFRLRSGTAIPAMEMLAKQEQE
jgi:GNAT superfamily N-acetyltransferase